MKIMTTSVVAAATLATALGGCTTIKNARDRIVRAPVRCEDQTVQIYFEPGAADVTDEGRAVIRAAAANASGCAVGSVEVLGLADAAGSPGANLELSKKRAQSVTAALAAAGLPAAEFQVAAAGQSGSVTANGQAAPLRRRADVVLHLKAK